MMKKILKNAVVLFSAGLIAAPAFAAEWGVSGQVRINWDVMKTIEEKGTRGVLPDGDGGEPKRQPAGVLVQGGDSWVSFDLKDEEKKVGGSLQYYVDGRRAFVGYGSASEGAWTAHAHVTVRDDEVQVGQRSPREGQVIESTRAGDQTIEAKHDSGFSFKLGFTTPLDTYRQGRDYLLIGADGDAPHITDYARDGADLGALDNRTNVAQFGFDIGDSLKLGLALQAADSVEGLGGSAFGSIDYGNNEPGTEGTVQGGLGNIGLKANFAGGPLNIGFVLVSAGESSLAASTDSGYEATASAIGLGVGLDLGVIKPYLNIWNPSTTSKNTADGEDKTVTSNTQFGVDLALGEHSGVGLAIVNRTTTYTDTAGTAGATETEDKTEVSTVELGYKTKLGGTTFQAAYVSDSIKATPANDAPTSEVSVGWIQVRLQQSF
jgi:hypothetical protein